MKNYFFEMAYEKDKFQKIILKNLEFNIRNID